jgi:uncharacterized protein
LHPTNECIVVGLIHCLSGSSYSPYRQFVSVLRFRAKVPSLTPKSAPIAFRTARLSISQDFDTLADDAVAAMREARRIAGTRCARVGYQGGSQGGWVAPLAATRAPVDFVIVSFGLAVSVIDEDQQQVALEMRLKGHSQEEISKALEVASAAEAVFESGFTEGFERFDAVRAKYRNEPWYKDLHGNYTHFILPYTASELREKGKDFVFGTPFRYDPMPTLRIVEAPQLWILGEEDLEAPSAETSRRIKMLIAEGKPITLALFPHAEHGMTEYEVAPNGERVSTRYAQGYFAMMRDFARNGQLSGSYGSSVVAKPNLNTIRNVSRPSPKATARQATSLDPRK